MDGLENEKHNEIEWDIVFSENSRSHTISIKWNEISKLEKWPWEKEFYKILFNSQSPINGQRIRFIDDENDLSEDIKLPTKEDPLLGSGLDSYIPIDLKELNRKIKFDLFSKQNITSVCRFEEGRSQRKRIGEWWFEPFQFKLKFNAQSVHLTLHLSKLHWWEKLLFWLFKITERKYYDVIWTPYASKKTVNINKNGEVSLTISEKELSHDSEIWYIVPKFNFKGSLFRLIGLISIGVVGSYIAAYLII